MGESDDPGELVRQQHEDRLNEAGARRRAAIDGRIEGRTGRLERIWSAVGPSSALVARRRRRVLRWRSAGS